MTKLLFKQLLLCPLLDTLGSMASGIKEYTPALRGLQYGGRGYGGQGGGHGGGWQGGGRGGSPGAGWQDGGQGVGSDHRDIIQKLLDNREKISRVIKKEKNEEGSDVNMAYTTTDDSDVAEWIKLHVKQMAERMDSGMMIRPWDELFVELYNKRNELTLDWEEMDNGVKATMMAANPDSPCLNALADAHGKLVTAFIENGRAEARKNHPAPNECS
jgi:hypothetical protein